MTNESRTSKPELRELRGTLGAIVRQTFEGIAFDAPHRPFVNRTCADRSIEAMGRVVPVEHAPFESRVAAFARDPREASGQGKPAPRPRYFSSTKKSSRKSAGWPSQVE